MSRFARCERDTKETEIVIELDLDGTGQYDIHTGIGFFDHMLEGFAKHGLFDLAVSVQGDTHVDAHHTVEDTGIVLGQAFLKALGDKKGIARFGYFVLPMDDALVLACLDFSGRMYFAYDTPDDYEPLVEAGRLLQAGGFERKSHKACCYVLIGYQGDTMEAAEKRLRDAWKAGFIPYAMLYRDEKGIVDSEWRKFQRLWVRPAIVMSQLKETDGR